MDLPDSLKSLGEQLAAGGAIVPAPELFSAYDVYATETARLFTRPWLAVDHASRLAADGDYFRAEAGARSVILVREDAATIHALRNACLHAGYRVCEEESGHGDHLFCQYHGWYYALDGRLTDPLLRPELTDRSRFRLPRYAMRIERGLILVDLSSAAPEPPPVGAVELGALPESLADAVVLGRKRYPTDWNWKYLRDFLTRSRDLLLDDGGYEACVEFGPLSFIVLHGAEAVLARIVPRYPGHSDFELIRLAAPEMAEGASAAGDGSRLTEALRRAGEAVAARPLGVLDRSFYEWYWGAMSEAEGSS